MRQEKYLIKLLKDPRVKETTYLYVQAIRFILY